jgi:hypothetical protein
MWQAHQKGLHQGLGAFKKEEMILASSGVVCRVIDRKISMGTNGVEPSGESGLDAIKWETVNQKLPRLARAVYIRLAHDTGQTL